MIARHALVDARKCSRFLRRERDALRKANGLGDCLGHFTQSSLHLRSPTVREGIPFRAQLPKRLVALTIKYIVYSAAKVFLGP
jgi:hypothetical protein